jgi:hypothetical protein
MGGRRPRKTGAGISTLKFERSNSETQDMVLCPLRPIFAIGVKALAWVIGTSKIRGSLGSGNDAWLLNRPQGKRLSFFKSRISIINEI